MRTHNKHPQWYNQPLRLSEEQRVYPGLVIDDFFECYHLHEVREVLWNWLVEVISSAHGIANDPHERNNHIFFYEKIEALVEASFVMQKKFRKQTRKKKRRKQA